jgi:hypothetical protein
MAKSGIKFLTRCAGEQADTETATILLGWSEIKSKKQKSKKQPLHTEIVLVNVKDKCHCGTDVANEIFKKLNSVKKMNGASQGKVIVAMSSTSSSYPSPKGEGRCSSTNSNFLFFHINLKIIPNQ